MTIYKRINIMLPTYGRSDKKLPAFIQSVKSTVSDKSKVCFTFMVKKTDTDTEKVIRQALAGWDFCILYEELEKPHLGVYFNRLYEETVYKDEETLVSMFGDDMIFDTLNWDTLLLLWANMFNGEGLFYGSDARSHISHLATYFVTSRHFVDAQKPYPFMCEEFPCDEIDVVWHMVAWQFHKLYYIPEMHLYHDHATNPGNMDDTWRHLRWGVEVNRGHRSNENRGVPDLTGGYEEYENKCLELLRKNIVDPKVGTILTTYDRVDLLEETISSYLASSELPDCLYVFDDGSKDIEQIKKILSTVPSYKLIEDGRHLGVGCRTPEAMKWVFENTDCEAVVILDSDCVMNRYWFSRAKALCKQMKDHKTICASLFNVRAYAGVEIASWPAVIKKLAVGGLGMIALRDFYSKYVSALSDSKYLDWDNKSCLKAVDSGETVVCSSPSFVQHTGIYEGTHVSNTAVSFAHDYIGFCSIYDKYSRRDDVDNKKVLFCLMGRYGDVILGSMVANMLMDAKFEVTWFTIPYYRSLVEMLCPRAKLIVLGCSPLDTWYHVSTQSMHRDYPGYKYYINAQPGAPENHNNLIFSGISMANFVKNLAERSIQQPLPNDFLLGIQFDSGRLQPIQPNWPVNKPLCIIAPEVISIPTALSPDFVEELFEQYSKEYHVRILVTKRPSGLSHAQIRNKYIFGLSFMQCIYMLYYHTSLFIGNDSGLAWAAILSRKCKKIIYHNKKRVAETNMLYGRIDPLAKDIIL